MTLDDVEPAVRAVDLASATAPASGSRPLDGHTVSVHRFTPEEARPRHALRASRSRC